MVAVMFIYVYADIKTLFQPEIPDEFPYHGGNDN